MLELYVLGENDVFGVIPTRRLQYMPYHARLESKLQSKFQSSTRRGQAFFSGLSVVYMKLCAW